MSGYPFGDAVATDSFAVTPGTPFPTDPNNQQATVCADLGLYIGTGGSVSVTYPNGTTLVFAGVPSGTFLRERVAAVNSATTASNIIGRR